MPIELVFDINFKIVNVIPKASDKLIGIYLKTFVTINHTLKKPCTLIISIELLKLFNKIIDLKFIFYLILTKKNL